MFWLFKHDVQIFDVLYSIARMLDSAPSAFLAGSSAFLTEETRHCILALPSICVAFITAKVFFTAKDILFLRWMMLDAEVDVGGFWLCVSSRKCILIACPVMACLSSMESES